MKTKYIILLNLLVVFSNFWIWRMLKMDLIIGLGAGVLSILFFLFTIKSNKKLLILCLTVTVLISLKLLISGFDNNLSQLTLPQQTRLNQRHGYFAKDLGVLFQNKFTLHYYKYSHPYLSIYISNVFNSLSPNLYFFSNHPREREKVHELNLYPSFLVIPFLLGFIQAFSLIALPISLYFIFSVFITGFIKQDYILGPVLFFPLINLLLTWGLLKIYKLFRK